MSETGGARVVVLAGPSGAGKSHVAELVGWPVLRLDDFYKNGGDPSLPRITAGPNRGLVDWDDPGSWLPDDALAAIRELCARGSAKVPVYEIAEDGRCGWQTLDLEGADLFLAEGIFAHQIVARLREEGLLADAFCVRQHPMVTFWRRLTRDLREHRKPPLVLVRRGVALLRAQRGIVREAVTMGCRPMTGSETVATLRGSAVRS